MAYATVDADSVQLGWTTTTGNDTTVRSLSIGSVYTDVLYTAQDGTTAALQVNDAFGTDGEAAVTSARVKLVHVAATHGLVTVSSPTDDGFEEVEVGYLNVGTVTWIPTRGLPSVASGPRYWRSMHCEL